MPETITLTNSLTLKEYYSAILYITLRNKRVKWYVIVLLSVLIISQVFGYVTLPNYYLEWADIVTLLLPLIMVAGILLFILFLSSMIIYLAKPGYFKNVSYVFNHWGMVKAGKDFEVSAPWRDILKVKETKAFFLIYLAKNNIHVVQKRKFSSPEEIDNFNSFLDISLTF